MQVVLVVELGAEVEAVAHVGFAVAGVVEVDVVARPVVEAVEVRAAGGILEGHPVGHHRDLVGVGLGGEEPDVGVVTERVGRGERCLPVTGAGAQGDRDGHRRERGRQCSCQDGHSAHGESLDGG